MYLNQATICGRLTRDPEVRSLETGSTVATFSLATNEYWTDKAGVKQEKVEFHNIVLWGKIAEIASQYLMKGQECIVQGKLQTRTYQGKDGVERRTTEIVGNLLQLGARAGGAKREDDPSYKRDQDQGRATPEEEKRMDQEIPTIKLDEDVDEIRIEDVPF